MGFFKLFRRTKAVKASKDVGGSKKEQQCVNASETMCESQASMYSVRIGNKEIIEAYMAAKNRHAPVEELLSYYTSEDAKANFDDHGSMTACQLVLEIRKLYEGFENILFTYESIEEVRPGEVLVEHLVVTGTHTADLRVMDFPVIPATNRHVVLDPERLWFTLKDGKIHRMEVTALGNLTGPPGLYVSVGGKLEMPKEN
ncbi:expressed unknown protein [Seminavis robusta]|uniref:SnoaL-like domain-containing protein n=1 Tax=Seminavis robusta TaxID=568900 RepID=A0A9N8E9A3_9STRA|nr:expressed unknown protein [Seminavis robusta]|eukprot:Sro832_g208470.1 n/a (200) ;mRNA; r:34513-35112